MKGMIDDLRALGETITDRHLILNLLQGLNKRFDHIKIFIELDLLAARGQASVFYSTPSGGGHPPQQQLPLRPPQ
jgi:hypothetical protein